jgi:hypothetical protein
MMELSVLTGKINLVDLAGSENNKVGVDASTLVLPDVTHDVNPR